MQPTSTTTNRGFTLLEVLVVLLIIGLTTSMALLVVPDSSRQQTQSAAKQLQQLLIAGTDESVYGNNDHGMQITKQGYQLLRLNKKSNLYEEIEGKLGRAYHWPTEVTIELTIDGEEDSQLAPTKPQILLLSDGQSTPYELLIKHKNDNLTAKISGGYFQQPYLEVGNLNEDGEK